MTEKTPEKKPRRTRRTKAEIEAEKASKGAANIPHEPVVRDREAERARLEARQEAAVVKEEEPVVSAKPTVAKKKEKEEYIPLTGLAKLRSKYAQRGIVDRSRGL